VNVAEREVQVLKRAREIRAQATRDGIWRGRTVRAKADEYAAYLYEYGIKPLEQKALGVQLFREKDRAYSLEEAGPLAGHPEVMHTSHAGWAAPLSTALHWGIE